MGWLRKASLRAAGIIPLHDEDAIFAAEAAQLGQHARRRRNLDWVAGITALKAVLIEGLEVVFIVIAVGAGRGLLMPAGLGALAACALVLAAGAIIHRPLSRVPENTLKFGVGVMLSAFGVFWTGEGLGVAWPGQDLALVLFAALFLAAGLVGCDRCSEESAWRSHNDRAQGSRCRIDRHVRRREAADDSGSDDRDHGGVFGRFHRLDPLVGGSVVLFGCLILLIESVYRCARASTS